MRGKRGIFLEPNVEEKRRVLYGVPNKGRMSNVPDGFSKIFPISWAWDEFSAGTSREENISIDDRTLGIYTRIMFGTLQLDVATVGIFPRHIPRLLRHSPGNCKVASISHTDLSTIPSSRPPTTWVSIFAGNR